MACEIPRFLDEKAIKIGMINEVADGLGRLMRNLSTNSSDEIVYKNDVILSQAEGTRVLMSKSGHTSKGYLEIYTLKFDEIILETQIQLRKRFQDFETLPLKNLCVLFDFKLWPKLFAENKKWGFDTLDEVLKCYCNYKFITEEEAKRCVRQWPLFRARVSRQRTEKVCYVYVDMLTENERDMDCILTLLTTTMTISSSTCQCERLFLHE